MVLNPTREQGKKESEFKPPIHNHRYPTENMLHCCSTFEFPERTQHFLAIASFILYSWYTLVLPNNEAEVGDRANHFTPSIVEHLNEITDEKVKN